MRAGVTMRDPSTVYLDWDVSLEPDVTLEPNVILRGATSVASGSVIGAGSQLVDATIGHGVTVWASVVESSVVEDGASVGPMSHLRPGTVVGAGAEVGNFAELRTVTWAPDPSSITRATWVMPRSVRASTSGRVPSPPTTTAGASTGRRSAMARSSASTR